MRLDESSETNGNVLQYLSQRKNHPPLALPNTVPDPYYKQGSHPDVVERIWDQLNKALPKDCRCLVYGAPALVHPKAGIILAFTGGTVYYVRLTKTAVDEAMKLGAKTHIKWTYSGEMNTQQELGVDWILGGWFSDEPHWCRMLYDELNEK